MKRWTRWLGSLAVVAAFGVAACEAPPETEETPAATEEMEPEGAAAEVEGPPLGTYTVLVAEGGVPAEGEAPAEGEEMPEATVEIMESAWTYTEDGEVAGRGTYAVEGDRVRVQFDEGDCAGTEAIFTWRMEGDRLIQDKVEAACEQLADHMVWRHEGHEGAGTMEQEEMPMEEGGAMEG